MGRCIFWEPSDMAKEGMTSPGDSHILDAGGLRDCCVSDEIRPPDTENATLTKAWSFRVSSGRSVHVPEP